MNDERPEDRQEGRQVERDSQLSAMFDGELASAECELLARRLVRDEALRGQWSRYALIGAALQKAGQVDLFFTYVTVATGLSLLVYIFALKNKKATHLDREQGDAWSQAPKDEDKDKDLVNA